MSDRVAKYDVEDPYGLVEYLMEGGVPVLQAQGPRKEEDQGKIFRPPAGWPTAKSDLKTLKMIRNLYRDRPAAALERGWGAVTGVEFDVIDVDYHNGGMNSWEKLREKGVLPPIYGWYRTPSLGWHLYVPRSGFRTKHRVEGFEGIDFQMGGDVPDEEDSLGRAFVYIYPTLKYGKLVGGGWTGRLSSYVLGAPVDLDLLREGTESPLMEPWREWLEGAAGARREAPELAVAAPQYDGEPHGQRERLYLAKALSNAYDEIVGAAPGDSWRTFTNVVYGIGQLVAGAGLDLAEAQYVLREAGRIRKVGDVEMHLSRNLRKGMRQPRAVPPPSEEWMAARAAEEDASDYAADQDEIIEEFMKNSVGNGEVSE